MLHPTSRGGKEPLSLPELELVERIGSGSYGEVWLARNPLGTLRAVKIVRRAEFDDARPYEREFAGIRKFEPLSRSHEGFVDLLQVGRDDVQEYFYYVMELADAVPESLPGGRPSDAAKTTSSPGHDSAQNTLNYQPRTLATEAKSRNALPLDDCLRIARTLTSALAELHRHGLVHRDVKPSNIIFVGGIPKLADIGLVASASEARSFVGTEGFIPPEGPGTPQADIYSLGIVLYVISTGKSHWNFPEPPGDLASRPDREGWLEFQAIIHRACQNDPRQRYGNAEAMLAELEVLQRGESVRRRRTLQHRWRVFKKAGMAVVLLVLVTAATFLGTRGRGDGELHSRIPEAEKLVKYADSVSAFNTPEQLAQAIADHSRAIQLEPTFAPAYIGLFKLRLGQWGNSAGHSSEEVTKLCEANLRGAATNLVRVAPWLAEAQLAASQLKWLDGRQEKALEEAEMATHMPASSKEGRGFVHAMYGWQLFMTGDQQNSLKQYLLAEKDDVASANIQLQLGNYFFAQREFDKALEHFDRSTELLPNGFWAYWCKGCVYEEKGEFLRAIEEFELADRRYGKTEAETKPFYDKLRAACMQGGSAGYWQTRLEIEWAKSPPDPHPVAVILAHLGRTDEAYTWLDKACREGKLSGLWFDPCWDHRDDRFKAIAKRLRSGR
jgi:serine/threonine protein kinase/tetratricopeptide (TPR) repeat protein